MQPRTKRLTRWAAIGLITAAVAAGSVAWAVDGARGHGPGFGMGFGPMRELMADLDLSAEQREQLRTIARTGWEQSADERAELDALRQQIETTVRTNGFNEAEVRALVDTGTPVLAALMVDMVRGLAEMRAVLTPEQQKLFDERRAQFAAERGRRGHRGSPRPPAE